MLNIIIVGINGKIGKRVYSTAKQSGINVVCGIDKNIVGEVDCPVYTKLDEVRDVVDVLVDFSSPQALDEILAFALENKCPLIIGTTGYSDKQIEIINKASKLTPIFMDTNFAVGINLILKLCTEAVKSLEGFDIEIVEKHHNQKIDAPSGTALTIANTINNAKNKNSQIQLSRSGKGVRLKDSIGVHSVRGGTLVGEHEIMFLGENESLSIKHTAYSKKLFSDGAIRACHFIATKNNGIYNMTDLLFKR